MIPSAMVPRISNPPGKIILTSDIQDIFEGYSYTESVLESDRFTTTSESEELDSGEYNRYERQSIEEPADNYQFDAVDTDSAISGKHTSHGVWSNEMADHIMPTIDSSDDELQHYGVETHASAKKRANESSTNELRSMSIQQPRVYPDDGSSSSIGGYSDQERKRFTKRRNTIDIEPTTTEAVETQGFSVPTLASTQGTSVFSSVHKIDKTENHSCAIDRQTPHVDTTTTYPGPIAESSDDESMEDLPQSATSEPSNLETMAAIVPDFDSEKNLDLELPIYKVIDIHAKSNPHNTPASTPPSSNIRFSSISATFPVFRRKSKKLSGYQ